MSDAWVGGLLALAGVLVASGLQFLRDSRRDDADRAARELDERLTAYAQVGSAFDEARLAAATVRSPASRDANSMVARVERAWDRLSKMEEAVFRAWLLANEDVRSVLDQMAIEMRRAAYGQIFPPPQGEEDAIPKWPDMKVLRVAMRSHLAQIASDAKVRPVWRRVLGWW